MYIHPLIVHFPIALLMLYTFFEVVRLPWLVRQQWYFYVKAVLVTLGTLGAYAAIITGDWFAESIPKGAPILDVVETHEMMASITACIFTALALVYILLWLGREGVLKGWVLRLYDKLSSRYTTPLLVLGSIAGFVALSITGGLGASMVHGPDIDPFVTIIYNLFF